MKISKRFTSAALAALITVSVAACGRGGADMPGAQTVSGDFQKNMHQSVSPELDRICETNEGIYFESPDWYVYYIDKATKRATILCSKPECPHNDATCGAHLDASTMWFYDGKLYFTNSTLLEENGQLVDHGNRIYSVAPDGTGRRAVQDLEFVPSGDTAYAAQPIMHRGVTYFAYNGVLYSLPLGEDIDNAEMIWGEEVVDDGNPIHDLGDLGRAVYYDLWADGETLYFMTEMVKSDRTRRDTLFAYDTESKEVKLVWETPGADEVGQWDRTGVEPSQWYVTDGVIYFYLSGNGLWRTDLDSGETVKLADTSGVAPTGTGIFCDDFLCVLNDEPGETGFLSYGDSTGHAGGDTLYLYGLDGELIRELSLKSLCDELESLKHFQLAFCTGGDIYFIADTSVKGGLGDSTQIGEAGGVPIMGSAMGIQRSYILYCADSESGEITKIHSWQWQAG